MTNEGMNGREIQFIPDRLIDEPVVFWGLTDTEIVFSVVGSVIFWIPITVLLLLPFNKALFGIGFGFGIALLTVFFLGRIMQDLKRRMPDGLHVIYLKKKLQRRSTLFNFGFIDQSMHWDIRRWKVITKSVEEIED